MKLLKLSFQLPF